MTTSSSMPPKLKRRNSLTGEVLNWLRVSIENGTLQPGAKLPTEQDLASQMGVSRTVVREAVAALKADGLVMSRQGVGAFVVEPGEAQHFRVDISKLSSIENVLQLLELRIGMETDMAGLAAERRTQDDLDLIVKCHREIDELMQKGEDSVDADFKFHLSIARATQNEYFIKFIRFLGTKTVPDRDLLVDAEHDAQYVALINAEHLRIVEAIKAQDVEAARKAARLHLLNSHARHVKKAGRPIN